MFLASSIAAFLRETHRVQLIEDGEVVAISPDGARFEAVEDGQPRRRDELEVDWDDEAAEKQGLRDVHAQGDLRAAPGGRGHDRRTCPGRQARARGHRARRPRDPEPPAHGRSSPAVPPTTPASSAATSSRSGRVSPASRTSRANGATGSPCSRRTPSSSASRSRARPGTRSTRSASPARWGRPRSGSRT